MRRHDADDSAGLGSPAYRRPLIRRRATDDVLRNSTAPNGGTTVAQADDDDPVPFNVRPAVVRATDRAPRSESRTRRVARRVCASCHPRMICNALQPGRGVAAIARPASPSPDRKPQLLRGTRAITSVGGPWKAVERKAS
jgi:hypothetical protein